MARRKKASVSIEPEIWERIRKIHSQKLGRKLGAPSPTNLVEKVLVAFIAKHDGNYDKYLKALNDLEKDLLSLDDQNIKGATLGDLDGSS